MQVRPTARCCVNHGKESKGVSENYAEWVSREWTPIGLRPQPPANQPITTPDAATRLVGLFLFSRKVMSKRGQIDGRRSRMRVSAGSSLVGRLSPDNWMMLEER